MASPITPPWVGTQADERAAISHISGRESRPPPLIRATQSRILTGGSGSDSDSLSSRLSNGLSHGVRSIVSFARRHLSWSPTATIENILPAGSSVVFVPNLTQQASGTTPAEAKSVAKATLRRAAQPTGAFDEPDNDAGEPCSICLMPVQHGEGSEDVAVMGCGHLFHAECYRGWAEKDKRTCPNCRCPLAIEDRAIGRLDPTILLHTHGHNLLRFPPSHTRRMSLTPLRAATLHCTLRPGAQPGSTLAARAAVGCHTIGDHNRPGAVDRSAQHASLGQCGYRQRRCRQREHAAHQPWRLARRDPLGEERRLQSAELSRATAGVSARGMLPPPSAVPTRRSASGCQRCMLRPQHAKRLGLRANGKREELEARLDEHSTVRSGR